ncbi:cation-transporting P-type ATPase [Leifsonia xyli subsp. cynodontis DSM 46306]|uniref:HMA domain-containing protein n=1 Tax=Leifsonia xyli subsp. cynodontis DSM 46306 TaxID=1389489 RepID=U3P678_LEIXC|nr:cation-translocating P-type ATPase [Leifsonia xyli]AGW40954.1 cation-transporting P-type ATPase [Leifsonia xyli subsp. cynodontis DSM 46306]
MEPALTRIDLAIEGMTCASCVARVERRLGRLDGVEAVVNLATERASVLAPAGVGAEALVAEVEKAGYGARVLADSRDIVGEQGPDARRLRLRLLVAAALSVPIVLLAMVPVLRFPGWELVSLALAAPVVLWAGWPFHRSAAVNLRHGATTMDTLVSLGTLVAFAWSVAVLALGAGGHIYVEVAAVVTTFLLLGRFAEERSRRRAGAALRDLVAAGAREVSRVDDAGRERRITADLLGAGERFAVRPGEWIAADGIVLEGAAAIDASAVIGESVPVEVAVGDEVTAGTIAAGGSLIVLATRVGPDTRVARLVAGVEAAQLAKTRAQRRADRVSSVFVPVVLGLAVLTFFVWTLVAGDPAVALLPAVAVLIVACPCALGLATPTALLVGTARAAQRGILLSGPDALERAGRIDTVVFDKTGTLTTGRMTLLETVAGAGWAADEALRLAAAAERVSEHPLGRAIAAEVPAAGPVTVFRSLPGVGVTACVAGREVSVGKAGESLPSELADAASRIRSAGGTAIAVSVDGVPAAVLGVGDPLRPDAAEAVARVRAAGAEPIVLSGDHPATVAAVTARLGIARTLGGMSPEGKAAAVASLRAEGRRVAMVGDGVNDAAALAGSDLGIALGSGTDAAMAAADITLLRPEPVIVGEVLSLSRRMAAVIRGNLFWAFAYNVAALPVAAFGLLDPMIAGAAMAFSSVFVVLNSLRLRRF